MSKQNVEIVRRWVDAYNRRDNEALVGLNDPDFEFRSIFVSIESVFRGVAAFPYAYWVLGAAVLGWTILEPLLFRRTQRHR
jgi:hypothetical protein